MDLQKLWKSYFTGTEAKYTTLTGHCGANPALSEGRRMAKCGGESRIRSSRAAWTTGEAVSKTNTNKIEFKTWRVSVFVIGDCLKKKNHKQNQQSWLTSAPSAGWAYSLFKNSDFTKHIPVKYLLCPHVSNCVDIRLFLMAGEQWYKDDHWSGGGEKKEIAASSLYCPLISVSSELAKPFVTQALPSREVHPESQRRH